MSRAAARLGILIPTRAAIMASARRPPLQECWEMARHADRTGYHSIWVGDSIVARPRLEAMTTLAYLSAITSDVRLGTAVLLPSLRQPVPLAHQIANVDQMSGGRVVLGLGLGSLGAGEDPIQGEWAACGADYAQRAKSLEEHVTVWRALWSGDPVSYEGAHFRLSQHTIGPLPWDSSGPKILITAGNGGAFLKAALERFARLGDGIIATRIEPEECRVLRETAEAALDVYRRALPDFPICVYTTVRLDDDVATAERIQEEFLAGYYGPGMRERAVHGLGPADVVITALKAYEAAGATDVCVRFAGVDQLAQLERFSKEVLPAFL